MPRRNRLPRLILALILLLLVGAPVFSSGVDLLVDWLWFGQEGYREIYITILKAQIFLSGLAGIGFMGAVAGNLLIARALVKSHGYRVYNEAIEFPALDRFSSTLGWFLWGGILLVGYLVGDWGSTHWLDYLLARHPVFLHQADPLFGLDVGFYLFQLPFRWFLYHLALVSLIGCLLGVLFLHLLEGGVWVTARGPAMASAAKRHLAVLAGLIFVLVAYRVRLAMYGLLFSARGIIYGAGYTDIHATLPILWFQLLLILAIAAALLFGATRPVGRRAVILIVGLLVVGILAGNVYPEIVQHLVVAPNETKTEAPYIARAIEFTRKAYALDRFEERAFSATENLAADDLKRNDATLRNVRLWDHNPLLTTFAQLQEIRTYYRFQGVDNDRYWINGVYRQVSLSPRELDTGSLPSRTWINEHLSYTHGYGLCLGPVNEYSSEGLPVLFIKDIPPASTQSLGVSRPEIYFGEVPSNYCFVKTHVPEFDYPSGERDVYAHYEGIGGIPVRGFWRRVLFALKFGEKNILFSSDLTPESRLLIYRQVLERAYRLTPFLRYDRDPYFVIAQDGTLDWILDGYTTSDQFPYSDPTPDVGNYIRNAVKTTVNAYSGEMRFYVSDPTDPLIQAYSEIFPGVFRPLEAMPKDLRAHIRYPEDFFSIQARKYAVFHMTDPNVFYNKEDLWRLAVSRAGGPAAPMSPYYTIMKLPNVGTSEEFILMVPFTPAQKDNMIAWMAARCDAPNYGKVLVFAFPKQRLVYGPLQLESRIDQDPTISQQLTLWDQHGSKVIRGTLLVIPVMNSVLYVEPLYLTAEAGGGLPQLNRVIVSYSNHVVMDTSLDAALSRIFGSGTLAAVPATAPPSPGAVARPTAGSPETQGLIREANQRFERAQQLLRQGEWAGYGEEMKKLGEVLKHLADRAGPQATK